MKIVLDTNIIVDVLEQREPFFASSYAVLRLAAEDKLEAWIPAGSISDIYYIVHRDGKSAADTREAIQMLPQLVGLCNTMASDISAAFSFDFADFEDAVLAATAHREKADYIITRNERDFRKSPVPALSPKSFLKEYLK